MDMIKKELPLELQHAMWSALDQYIEERLSDQEKQIETECKIISLHQQDHKSNDQCEDNGRIE